MQVCNNCSNQKVQNSHPSFKGYIRVDNLSNVRGDLIRKLQAEANKFAPKSKEFGTDFFSGLLINNKTKVPYSFIIATGNDHALPIYKAPAMCKKKRDTIDEPLLEGIRSIVKKLGLEDQVSVTEYKNNGDGRIIRSKDSDTVDVKAFGIKSIFDKKSDGSYSSDHFVFTDTNDSFNL